MAGARLYGWKKDPESPRDLHAHRLLSALPEPPEEGSLRDRVGGRANVRDQKRSDCVGNGSSKAIQVTLSTPTVLAPAPSVNWIYYQAGCIEGSQKIDNGRYIRDALDACARVGWPDEADWPYDGRWDQHPGATVYRRAYDNALPLSMGRYRITGSDAERKDQLKRAISGGFSVVGGMPITEAWEQQDGKTPLALDLAALPVGGHAFAILEYDAGGFRPLNSWGPDWADGGWGYLSWDWITELDDAWVVALVPKRQGVV